MVPTKEEELKLLNCNGDMNELDPAERFLASILRIPCSFLKVEAMLYAETFEDEVSQIRKSFDMLEEACKELRSSRLFLKLLEAVLRTGNRTNAGTMRGGARRAHMLEQTCKEIGTSKKSLSPNCPSKRILF